MAGFWQKLVWKAARRHPLLAREFYVLFSDCDVHCSERGFDGDFVAVEEIGWRVQNSKAVGFA